jgi:HlyD family secretion protein
MKIWKIMAISLFIMVLIGSAGCSLGNGQSQTGQQVAIAKGDIAIKVNGTGKISYANDAKLSFSSAGKIEKLNIKKGDKVSKGTVLAMLETDSLELSLSQFQTAEAQAQATFTKSQADLTQAQIALTQAEIAQTQAESAVSAAQFNLDKVQAVKDIKDDLVKLYGEIQYAEMLTQDALVRNDPDAASYWKQEKANSQIELVRIQNRLAKLLSGDEFTGVATYEIEGQKYDRLVVADVRMKQLALTSAQQSVEQAKQNVELSRQNIQLTKQNIEQASKALAQVQKNIEFTQKQINQATITAPFDGIIATLDAKEGDFTGAPGTNTGPLIYMVNPESLEINTEIDEIDVANVQANQKAVISLDALPDTQFEGNVKSISVLPIVKSQNSGVVVYEVKVGFTGAPPAAAKSGMSTSVDIITREKKEVLLVPNKSLKKNGQGQMVVSIVNNNKVEERTVVLGLTDGNQTEVVSGLNAGDTVIKYAKETNSKLS